MITCLLEHYQSHHHHHHHHVEKMFYISGTPSVANSYCIQVADIPRLVDHLKTTLKLVSRLTTVNISLYIIATFEHLHT